MKKMCFSFQNLDHVFPLHRSILRRGHHISQALQPHRPECVLQGEDDSAAPLLRAAQQRDHRRGDLDQCLRY